MTNKPGSTGSAVRSRPSLVSSALVFSGILLSRCLGLIRERLVAVSFGTSLHADVFSAAMRMPNVLQNMLGEGTLSASFIPVYSELLAKGRTEEAGRLAGAIFALLLALAGALSLLGVALAPALVTVVTPGFEGQRRELMIVLVRILFPMTGVLVLSAWALGVLNSHRKFFIPYFAPVLWNAAIIGTLIVFSRRLELDALLIAAGWGALVGGLLQFGFQLPWVLRLDRSIRLRSGRDSAVREVLRNAGPAIVGRGVVQLSAYLDMVLASLLAIGAVARLRYAQSLYLLPISLFAMSVAAAELPLLARERDSATDALRERAGAALRRVSFYVVPSLVAFILLGEVFVAGLYEGGNFTEADVTLVWITLAAYSTGLLASTSARIYQSALFALRDTKTPARIAGLRVLVSSSVGAVLMLQFEAVAIGNFSIPAGVFSGLRVQDLPLGPVGLALGATAGAWFEWALLRRSLTSRIGDIGGGFAALAKTFAAALTATLVGHYLNVVAGQFHPLQAAVLVTAGFAVVYLCVAYVLGLTEARAFKDALSHRIRRKP